MLLTETINNSTNAIKTRRYKLESKQHAEKYKKALSQLSQVTASVEKTLNDADEMKNQGIVDSPLIDANAKQEILNCINDIGNGIAERTLTMDTVSLLQSKNDVISSLVKSTWKISAEKYSESIIGYLSMIGGLTDNPAKARTLLDNIKRNINSSPSVRIIREFVDDVDTAKSLTDSFSISSDIEMFLQKVSMNKATVADLTPTVLTWLKAKNLIFKVKLRF